VCECDGCLPSEHNTYTQSEDLVHDQNIVVRETLIPTYKICPLNDQARWVKRLTRAHKVNPNVCKHQVKLSREALKFDAGQNFGGVAVATTLGDTLVKLQLLCFGSFIEQGLGLSGSIELLCGLLWFAHLLHG